jgi:hypothetical protein
MIDRRVSLLAAKVIVLEEGADGGVVAVLVVNGMLPVTA